MLTEKQNRLSTPERFFSNVFAQKGKDMFLTLTQQTTDNFKENIKNLLDDCLNSQNKINTDKLPEALLVGDASLANCRNSIPRN
mgnify:CR=1 FL=1